MFGSTEYENECAGCAYDFASDNAQDIIDCIERCIKCKRVMKPEYKDQYDDLYLER